jgi:CysZ protein
MAPVTALFAGLFLDDVAAKVEQAHYANDKAGEPLSVMNGLGVSLRFGALLLLVNILALPLVFTGIGAVALVIINAYMLSREYFEMAAMRHLAIEEAREFRKANAVDVFVAGMLPALMTLVPFLNLLVPLFSTSYFVHLFKRLRRSSA